MNPVRFGRWNLLLWWYRISWSLFGLRWVGKRFEDREPWCWPTPKDTCTIAGWIIATPLTVLGLVPSLFLGGSMAMLSLLATVFGAMFFNAPILGLLLTSNPRLVAIPLYLPKLSVWGRRVPMVPLLLWVAVLYFARPWRKVSPVLGWLRNHASGILSRVSYGIVALVVVIGLGFVVYKLVKTAKDPDSPLGAIFRSVHDKTCRPVVVE